MSYPSMNVLGQNFARSIANHPFRYLLLSLLLVAACASGARFLQPDFTYRAFFGVGDPLRVQIEQFEDQFGNDDSVVLMVHSPSGILDAETSALIADLTEKMWLVPDVARVDSLSNFRWVRAIEDDILVDEMIPSGGLNTTQLLNERQAAISGEPLIPEYLLSADGKTTMIVGVARAAGNASPEATPIIEAVREMIPTEGTGDHEFHITGRLAIMAGMQESAQADLAGIMPFVLLAIIGLLVVCTRRIHFIPVTLLFVVASIVSTMGSAGWMGMTISNITAMVPQFILAIAVAASVHILIAFHRARARGHEKKEAVEKALGDNFVPTLLTAVTTAVAFGTFMATDIVAIGNLGLMVGFGVVLAWIYTYILLGSLLRLIPEIQIGRKSVPANAPVGPTRFETLISNLVDRVAQVRLLIVAGAVALTAAAVIVAVSNTINSNPFKYFDESFWLRQSSDFAEENLRGTQGIELVLYSGETDGVKQPEFMEKANALQDWISGQEFVAKTVSIIDFVKQTNEALNGDDPAFYKLPETSRELSELMFLYSFNLPEGLGIANRVTLDNSAMRISVRWTLYDSALATEWAERIEDKAAELGLNAETTGKMLLFQRMNNYVSEALLISLGLATFLISLIILGVFRSAKYGFVSLLTNLMPLGVGGAVLALASRDVDTGAVVAMSVCLGVVVDDTIHLLHAIRSYDNGDKRAAIKQGMSKVLPAITLTTLILMFGFGAFMMGDFVPNQNFGLLAMTIVGVAWLFDVFFVPALLMLIGDRKREAKADPLPAE